MSGICGWFSTETKDEQTIIRHMVDKLGAPTLESHSEAAGINGLGLAYKPLCGDLSRDDQLWICYEGAIHWYSEKLQSIANDKGHSAVIKQLYTEHGVDALKHIHGSFSLAIIDLENNSALLAIDRIGVSPLCYSYKNSSLIFSSSAKSIVQHPDVKKELSPQSIYNYLYYHMVPSPDSIYKDVQKLLPGQYIHIKGGQVTKDFYWELDYKDSTSLSEDDLSSRLQQLLMRNIHRYTRYGKTGAFLSGGTDSSTMAGVLSRELGEGVDTFSIGFDADGFDESEYARITSRHFKTSHHEYNVTPDDVADAIPFIASSYDEPFGNASAVPTYFCAKMARENGIDVMIAGDGGDEIFAGNERYAKQQIFEKYFKLPLFLRKKILEPLFINTPGIDKIPVIKKISSFINQACTPLPDRLEAYNFMHHYPLDEIFYPEFLSEINIDEPLGINREVYQRTRSAHHVNRMMHLDMKNTLADNDLRKVGKMCDLAGVQVFYPLLDEELVEFAAKIPAEIKLKEGRLRYLFKYALKDFLPQETLTKSKHGFGLPFGIWLKDNARLQDITRSSMDSLAKRGIIKPSFIEQLMKQHRYEHASYYGVMVWIMIMLQYWLEANDN